MAMPNPFQKLKHGVLLCKKNFDTFVETFNFLVDFSQNIKGDGDANGNGTIVFDRTVPDRPVIRSKINLSHPAIGSGLRASCFEIRRPNGSDTGGFDNPYYLIGTKTYCYVNARTIGFDYSNCVIGILVSFSGDSPTPSIVTAESISELNEMAEESEYTAVIPLYEVNGNGIVTCDFRSIPTFSVWER